VDRLGSAKQTSGLHPIAEPPSGLVELFLSADTERIDVVAQDPKLAVAQADQLAAVGTSCTSHQVVVEKYEPATLSFDPLDTVCHLTCPAGTVLVGSYYEDHGTPGDKQDCLGPTSQAEHMCARLKVQ
jgi:hypothetical protein